MITIQTQSDGVLFNFQDSTRYLYGDGSILTPYNSLTLIADESNVLTFRKSASNDIFITAGYDELGYSSKEEAINDLKTKLFKATGGGSESGITSGDVQTMIDDSLEDYYDKDEIDAGFASVDASLSGKADASDVTEEISAAVSGKADTTAVTAVNNALTAHTADTGIHVSQLEKDGWNAKLDASAYTPVDLSEYWTSAQTEVAISAATSGKADTSAVTAVASDVVALQDALAGKANTAALTAHTSDSDIHVSAQEKNAWNAKAEPYSAGTGIEISGNVISATGGSSVTVDPTLDTGSTNPVANSAITNSFNGYTLRRNSENGEVRYFYVPSPAQPYGGGGQMFSNFSINGRCPLTQSNGTNSYIDKFSLVETSAITSAITSASTNAEVAGAKAVYDAIQAGGGGGGSITVDSGLDNQSTNPVENQVITQEIDDINAVLDTKADQSELYELLGGSNDEMNPVTPIRLLRISQSDYDTLVENYETDPDTLYIITPDEENEGGE